ncbi:protein kinase [Streptomyces sp. NPDC006879]|uniref:protein kinase domain-containing protein n=1 Tax=Streptomyces sp. NPDC006879 TaxID=3364767 RepID=UPI0036931BED
MQPLQAEEPRTIGAYRLLGRLGTGGMGRVYLGRSAGGRTVAIKIVHPQFAADEQFRARFRRDVEAARRVGGEWTAPVLDADPDATVPWVATGYVAGPSLARAVAVHGPLPEATVRALGAGLAEALCAVHDLGLVHRDVKPSNVLLAVDGPRLIDFGIARATEVGASLTGVSIGSPAYMAPEQIQGKAATGAADVFSMGAVLAFAATGVAPFCADSSAGLLHQVVHEAPRLDGPLTGVMRELVSECLEKSPMARPAPHEVAAFLAPAGVQVLMAEAWLPASLVAEVGRAAVKSLELEPSAPTSEVDDAEVAARAGEADAADTAGSAVESVPKTDTETEAEATATGRAPAAAQDAQDEADEAERRPVSDPVAAVVEKSHPQPAGSVSAPRSGTARRAEAAPAGATVAGSGVATFDPPADVAALKAASARRRETVPVDGERPRGAAAARSVPAVPAPRAGEPAPPPVREATVTVAARRRVRRRALLAVGALAVAAVGGLFALDVLPGGGDGDAEPRAAGAAGSPSVSAGPGGAVTVPVALIGTWKGTVTTARLGVPSEFEINIHQGRVGDVVARDRSKVKLRGQIYDCSADWKLVSATVRAIVLDTTEGPNPHPGICSGGSARESFALTPTGALHYRSGDEAAGQPEGDLSRRG